MDPGKVPAEAYEAAVSAAAAAAAAWWIGVGS